MLYNGYGAHNIQGIGDKHVPLVHNVYGTDFVVGLSDQAPDHLNLLFNTAVGQDYLSTRYGIDAGLVSGLTDLGLSSIANVVASIKLAKYLNLGENDVVLTVATDGADLYKTELEIASTRHFPNGFGTIDAAEVFGQFVRQPLPITCWNSIGAAGNVSLTSATTPGSNNKASM